MNKQKCISLAPVQGNEKKKKNLSAKTFKALLSFLKISFNMDIMDLFLMDSSQIPFKRQLESIIRVSEVVLANHKIPKPIDAWYIEDGILLSKHSIFTLEKRNESFFMIELIQKCINFN